MSNSIATDKAAANYQSLPEGMVRDPFRAAKDLQNVTFAGMATTVQVWADWSSEDDAK